MKMVGHKTESVYRRYAIVDEAMLRDAAAKLAAARGQSAGQTGLAVITPLSRKDVEKLVGRDGIEPPTPEFSVLNALDGDTLWTQSHAQQFRVGLTFLGRSQSLSQCSRGVAYPFRGLNQVNLMASWRGRMISDS